MIKYVNHDIVFQEYPDEVTLAINLSLCPNHCEGCHSAFLAGNVGEELTAERLFALIDSYLGTITCVGLQGGDNDTDELLRLLAAVKEHYGSKLCTGWYSGRDWIPEAEVLRSTLDYLKTGPYIPKHGPLSSPDTNQRFYRVEADGTLTDLTYRFAKRHV